MTTLDNLQNLYFHGIAVEEMLKQVTDCVSNLQSSSQVLKLICPFDSKLNLHSTDSETIASRDFERAVLNCSSPLDTEVPSFLSNAVDMLYRSHRACELYTLFNASIEKHYQNVNRLMTGGPFVTTANQLSPTAALVKKQTSHIVSAIKQVDKILLLRTLKQKLDFLKTSLQEKFDSSELESINLHLEKIGLDAQIFDMNERLMELNRLLERRMEQHAQLQKTKDEVLLLQDEMGKKYHFIKDLHARNQELWLQLPSITNETLEHKNQLLDSIWQARQAMEEISKSDLNRRLTPHLQIRPFDPLRPTVYDGLYDSPLYNKCCDVLNLHKPYKRVDLVLQAIVSHVIQHRLCLEERAFLRDTLVINEEELRTIVDLFRRDASIQKKVGKSVRNSVHQAELLVDSIKSISRWCSQMIDCS